jgi:menaquinone-dependent protoporphyrinogen oxidase
MRVLVAYASLHGATQGIAERMADRLRAAGHLAEAQPTTRVGDLDGYDAFVIGGAAYIGRWLKDATEFVLRHRAVLAERPTWLFSSGPLGTDPIDAQGRDQRDVAQPKEFAELRDAVHPRELRVFFGALDPSHLGLRDRAIRTLPAGRALLPEGDFRNWPEIDAWAAGIAVELTMTTASHGVQAG